MRKLSVKRETMIRLALAGGAGLLLTAAFPSWDLKGAAWIGPGLMLFAAMGLPGKQAFRIGFTAGLIHALTSLSWLLSIPYTFHGLPLAPALGWVLLSAYVALYHGTWVWACWRMFPGQGCIEFARGPWWQRAWWCLICGCAWVALEMIRARFLSGFPWIPLGASQYKLLPLIQVAAFGGVYAVSFLVSWTSVSVGCALVSMVKVGLPAESSMPSPRMGRFPPEAFPPLLGVALVVSFGMHRLMSAPVESNSKLKVALIQPSIPQTLIWDQSANAQRFQTVMRLSEEALKAKPDLLVWPESALPETSEENVRALARMAVANKVWIIISADDFEPPEPPAKVPKYFNASFLISPEGRVAGRYRKVRLVIFGEYVPLTDWLPFLKWFTPVEGGFTPGNGPVPFNLANPFAQASVLICFEDVFPHEARRHVTSATDFLLNLTNDGWFGQGAAQWQQAATALFRAIENGVPLVRCTNNGLTCWIDAFGRIREIGSPDNIYGPGYLIADIPLKTLAAQGPTFYNLHGDIFGWSCFGLAGILLVQGRIRKQRVAKDHQLASEN